MNNLRILIQVLMMNDYSVKFEKTDDLKVNLIVYNINITVGGWIFDSFDEIENLTPIRISDILFKVAQGASENE